MPDIQLRFKKDMLVLSAPLDVALARQGLDPALDRQYLNLMEPDAIRDALRLEVSAGAQCVVTTTEDITRARLAHIRMDGDAPRLAKAALDAANAVKPQHILVEIGPCGLPLDASSKSSLNENRSQYADAARTFAGGAFDAFFLNGFTSIVDLKCALMGVSQVSDKPIFASVTVGASTGAASAEAPDEHGSRDGGLAGEVAGALPFADGYALADAPVAPPVPAALRRVLDPEQWPGALDAMIDLGAAVVGFETADPITQALSYAQAAASRTDRPVLTQLHVTRGSVKPFGKGLVPLEDIDEYTPDTMSTAAVKLYGSGVQFVRATGAATPAHTGALAATLGGLDVRVR